MMEPILLERLSPARSYTDSDLYDLGDGICCFTFRSKGNSITPTIKTALTQLLDQNLLGYDGMVIGSQAKFFSAGADLASMLDRIERKQYDVLQENINIYQQMTLRLKYYHKPVVTAPYHMTLGGGLELVLHSHKRIPQDNVHMGLVESGVGLLPGGGGSKEIALRMAHLSIQDELPVILSMYEALLLGKTSRNAQDARAMHYLRPEEAAVGAEEQLAQAKRACLSLCRTGFTGNACGQERVVLGGAKLYQILTDHAAALLDAGTISPYDLEIGKKIALIMSGSETETQPCLTEQQILDLERSCFLALTQDPRTAQRISHFLTMKEKLKN